MPVVAMRCYSCHQDLGFHVMLEHNNKVSAAVVIFAFAKEPLGLRNKSLFAVFNPNDLCHSN